MPGETCSRLVEPGVSRAVGEPPMPEVAGDTGHGVDEAEVVSWDRCTGYVGATSASSNG